MAKGYGRVTYRGVSGGVVAATGIGGTGVTGWYIVQQITANLTGKDWVHVVVVIVTAVTILAGIALMAVGVALAISEPPTAGGTSDTRVSQTTPGLILSAGLVIVLAGLATLAVVAISAP